MTPIPYLVLLNEERGSRVVLEVARLLRYTAITIDIAQIPEPFKAGVVGCRPPPA